MNISRTQLLNILSSLSSGLGTTPSHSSFYFTGNSIYSTNGQIMMEVPFASDFICSIPGKTLLDLLKSLPEDSLEISFIRSSLVLKSSTISARVNGSSDESKLSFERSELTSFDSLDDLIAGLRFCSTAVSKDSSDGTRCGVYINGDTLLATDRFRVARYRLKSSFPWKFSIPLSCINVLDSISSKCTGVALKEKEYIEFGFENGLRLRSSLLCGFFSDVSKAFPNVGNYVSVQFNQNLFSILKKHSFYQKSTELTQKELSVYISGDYCMFSSSSDQIGDISEKVPCVPQYNGDVQGDVSFYVSPVLFQDVDKTFSSFAYYPASSIVLLQKENCDFLIMSRS